MSEVHDYEVPDWAPLRAAVGINCADGWMWMSRSTRDGLVVEHYKHSYTRSYLNLDREGRAWSSRIAEHGCSPWCDLKHTHHETTFEHFEVPIGPAIEEALR